MRKDIVAVKDKVEMLLAEFPDLRDCDKKLWIAYLTKYCDLREKLGEDGWHAFKEMLYEKGTPTMESVRRTRQKFQESGKYLGEKRKEKLQESGNMKDWAITNQY